MNHPNMRRAMAKLHQGWSRIHLVDRCLLLLMAALLLQSVCTPFLPGGDGQLFGNIDIAVRTSAAAIFGYFLSANFASPHESLQSTLSVTPESRTEPEASAVHGPTSVKNRIGFSADPAPTVSGGIQTPEAPSSGAPHQSGTLQVLVAAGIGLFCLGTLILLRDLPITASLAESDTLTATVTQFRDFLSSCVGFLIGWPSTQRSR